MMGGVEEVEGLGELDKLGNIRSRWWWYRRDRVAFRCSIEHFY